ncbi:protein SUPPRESSOR OF GENE SILENCING 3-like [Argentina anserina]|uniref:protein SUPPRESSOR OF GENE SILENCING 3-like n=1 Tax=Argentina anserina TaxID=57926 RepID=UPI002176461E|nr:protein SUPPRESSOR OF GENE SILENCING 3-like [Potentilla anserina]
MSSRRANGNGRDKQVIEVNSRQLSQGVADLSLGSEEDSGGWEQVGKKSKNRTGSNAAKGAEKSNTKAWALQDVQKDNVWSGNRGSQVKPAGRGNSRPQPNSTPQQGITPALPNGWNWKSKVGNSDRYVPAAAAYPAGDNDESDPSSDLDDDDDDDNDDYDDIFSDESDSSRMSHDTQKNSKWFKDFFDILDKLRVEEINDPNRQWHCPACKRGPGAIDWYKGMQPLIRHAETKGSKRVKLHRQLAQLLEAEMKVRGTSAIPAGVVFDKWVVLNKDDSDHKIIWPPMVFIMNTRLEKDASDKWKGMGNEELLQCFTSYRALKGKHSYGPEGHRGMSTLIFEPSAMGYFEAARLHRHFAEQGLGKDAWDHSPVLFRSDKRQLYGYMPTKQDLDIFNQHSEEKLKLKFEIRSYEEMVLHPLRKMSDDSQQVNYMKTRVAKEEKHSQGLEEALRIVNEKMLKIQEENRVLRERTRMHYEQNKDEMDLQEEFYKDMLSRTQN